MIFEDSFSGAGMSALSTMSQGRDVDLFIDFNRLKAQSEII
jgi:hypothetical protein